MPRGGLRLESRKEAGSEASHRYLTKSLEVGTFLYKLLGKFLAGTFFRSVPILFFGCMLVYKLHWLLIVMTPAVIPQGLLLQKSGVNRFPMAS